MADYTLKIRRFDPESGDNLTRNEEEASRIAAESEEDRQRALERSRNLEARTTEDAS